MNIFVLSQCPEEAARFHCDKHVPKMCVEAAQMLASAVRRHGATDDDMPLTKAGTPYKGGHPHHPCTVWAGETRRNFSWLAYHAKALCAEYTLRFGRTHACFDPIHELHGMCYLIPDDEPVMTPFAQAMPDEYRDDDVVTAYRAYYHSKDFAVWAKGRSTPDWW